MCNLCNPYNEPEELIELKPAEAKGQLCDSTSYRDETEICGEPARFCRIDPHVDAHLCEEHMKAKKAALEAELPEFQRKADVAQSAVIKPIESAEFCDEIVDNDRDCQRPARYALVVKTPVYLCETHKLWDE